jgi:ribosome biogenesis protein MAK21
LIYPAEKKYNNNCKKSTKIELLAFFLVTTGSTMAKSKKTTSAGAEKPVATSKSKDASDENFLQFDAGALASLTQNIEARLKGGNKNNKSNSNGASEKKGAKGPKSPASKPNGKGKANKPVENNRPVQKSFQGKKRDRNGAVIEKEDKVQKGENLQKTNPQDEDDEAGDEDDVLRKEILALGGSKEDFDLLAGVVSDSEAEDSAQTKPALNEDALRKELAKLLKGSDQYQAEIPDDQVSEEEEEEASDEELSRESDEEEDNEVESEAEEANGSSPDVDSAAGNASKKSIVEPQPNPFPKEYSQLVSRLWIDLFTRFR